MSHHKPKAALIATIVCAACLLVMRPALAAPEPAPPHSVQFFVAEIEPAAGLTEVSVEDGPNKSIYLHEKPVLTGADIAQASVIMDTNNRPAIDISFNKTGQEKLSKATSENIGKRLAIVVGGKVISAPSIRSKIAERAQVSGNFSKAEADKLVQSIRPAEKSP